MLSVSEEKSQVLYFQVYKHEPSQCREQGREGGTQRQAPWEERTQHL